MVRTSVVHLVKNRYLEWYGGSGYQDFNMPAYQITEIRLLFSRQQGANLNMVSNWKWNGRMSESHRYVQGFQLR